MTQNHQTKAIPEAEKIDILVYKRFWTMLFHQNVWRDPRYVERKQRALQQDPQRRKLTYHRRDLMPECVVDMVRLWLPNPSEQPYMGHKWE